VWDWLGIAQIGTMASAHTAFIEKTEDKRPTGRPRRGQNDNIENDLKEKRW
jgi:hypothetical protein